MPTIPLLTQGAVNADFNGPRQRGGGDRIDTSELQNAYGALRQATGQGVRIPLVDVSSGLQNLGQSVSGVGQQMLKIQEHNQQLTNTRRMADTENAWYQSQDELKIKLSDPKIDPNDFARIAQEHNQQFINSINTEGMTEEARHHLVENWLKTQVSRSNTTFTLNGVMENERRARGSLDARVELAKRQRDPTGFIEAEREKENRGMQTTEETSNNIQKHAIEMQDDIKDKIGSEVNTLLKQGKVTEARAVIDQHPDMKFIRDAGDPFFNSLETSVMKAEQKELFHFQMATNPNQFLKDIKDARAGKPPKHLEGLAPAELMDMENETYAVVQEESNKATYDARNNVENGVLTKESELFSNPAYNKMSPVDKSAVRAILQKRQVEGTKFNPEAWMSFATSIPSIEVGTPKGALAEAQMRNFIGIVFPGKGMENYRTSLEKMLDKHMAGSPSDADNQAMKILLDGFKSGGFGVTEVPYDPGHTPGYLDSVLNFATFGAYKAESKPGTPLSPEDQARLNQPDKIAGEKNAMKLRPGQRVVDQRAYADAQKMLFDAQSHIEGMRKAGKTEKEMVDFARSVLRVSALRGIVKPQNTPAPAAQRLQKATDLLNKLPEPNNTLFPN